jgi:hypothetical protein
MTTTNSGTAPPGAADLAAAIHQTTLPLTSWLGELAKQLAIWAARRPGAVASEAEREAATGALKALDSLGAELLVIRARLREQITLNDSRMMVLAAAEREAAADV